MLLPVSSTEIKGNSFINWTRCKIFPIKPLSIAPSTSCSSFAIAIRTISLTLWHLNWSYLVQIVFLFYAKASAILTINIYIRKISKLQDSSGLIQENVTEKIFRLAEKSNVKGSK